MVVVVWSDFQNAGETPVAGYQLQPALIGKDEIAVGGGEDGGEVPDGEIFLGSRAAGERFASAIEDLPCH